MANHIAATALHFKTDYFTSGFWQISRGYLDLWLEPEPVQADQPEQAIAARPMTLTLAVRDERGPIVVRNFETRIPANADEERRAAFLTWAANTVTEIHRVSAFANPEDVDTEELADFAREVAHRIG